MSNAVKRNTLFKDEYYALVAQALYICDETPEYNYFEYTSQAMRSALEGVLRKELRRFSIMTNTTVSSSRDLSRPGVQAWFISMADPTVQVFKCTMAVQAVAYLATPCFQRRSRLLEIRMCDVMKMIRLGNEVLRHVG